MSNVSLSIIDFASFNKEAVTVLCPSILKNSEGESRKRYSLSMIKIFINVHSP
jgi:hypothetical protein